MAAPAQRCFPPQGPAGGAGHACVVELVDRLRRGWVPPPRTLAASGCIICGDPPADRVECAACGRAPPRLPSVCPVCWGTEPGDLCLSCAVDVFTAKCREAHAPLCLHGCRCVERDIRCLGCRRAELRAVAARLPLRGHRLLLLGAVEKLLALP